MQSLLASPACLEHGTLLPWPLKHALAGLSYAPTLPKPETGAPSSNGNGAAPAAAVATIVAAPPRPKPAPSPRPAVVPAAPAPTGSPSVTLLSMEEDDMSTEQIQCRDALRAGKRLLKEKNGSAAMVRFEKALMLSKALGDKVGVPVLGWRSGSRMCCAAASGAS